MSVSMSDTNGSASLTSGLLQADSKPDVKGAQPATVLNGQTATSVSFPFRERQGGPVFGDNQSPASRQNYANDLGRAPNAPATQGILDSVRHWFAGHRPPHHPCWGKPPPRPNPGCSNPPPRPNPGTCPPPRPDPGCRPPPPRPDPGCRPLPPRPDPGCRPPPPRPDPGCRPPPPRPDPGCGKPPLPGPCPGKPYPIAPGRPDPHYSLKNNEQLAQQLRDNFHAFRDPKNPGSASIDSIYAMARRGGSSDPVMNENIRLANELLRRPDLLSALDRHTSTGALDGKIDMKSLNAVIRGENYFKFKTDKELAREMLEHFNELKSNPRAQELSFSDLRRLAGQSQTGDSAKNHLIQLAQEILKRSDVLKKMDNLAGRDNDGRISLKALQLLSR